MMPLTKAQFEPLKREIEKNEKDYPHLFFKGEDAAILKKGYVGFITGGPSSIIYLTILSTLPIFDNLLEAKVDFINSTLPLSNELAMYDFSKEMSSTTKMVKFLADRLNTTRSNPNAMIILPEHLQKLIKEVGLSEVSVDVAANMLSDKQSPAHQRLLELSKVKLNAEVSRKWRDAKEAFCKFHLIQFISLLFQTIILKWHTARLVRSLENHEFSVSVGATGISSADQCRHSTTRKEWAKINQIPLEDD